MKNKEIRGNLNNYEVNLKFTKYQHHNNWAIVALIEDSPEVYDTLTVNPEHSLPDNVVAIRSDKEEYVDFLVGLNLIEEDLVFAEPSGYIFLEHYKLTEKAQKIAKLHWEGEEE